MTIAGGETAAPGASGSQQTNNQMKLAHWTEELQ